MNAQDSEGAFPSWPLGKTVTCNFLFAPIHAKSPTQHFLLIEPVADSVKAEVLVSGLSIYDVFKVRAATVEKINFI
jgi:hypothetical protein